MITKLYKTAPTAELLIVELPRVCDYELTKEGLFVKEHGSHLSDYIEGSYTLLGKPDEIREEDVEMLVEKSIHTGLFAHYVKGIPVNTYCYKTATESLLSLLESEIDEQFDFKRTLIFKKN